MNEPATILLVDDDPAVLMTVGDRLAFEGYRVIKAASGDEALQHLRSTAPDLLILDISMPGMTGLAFLKKISTPDGKPRYPVLVFTARSNMSAFFGGTEVEGFLPKTSDPGELLRETARIIAKTRRATQTPAAPPAAHTRRRILILEDDPHVSAQMIGFFSTAGYDTTWVKNPAELITSAMTRHPDVILIRMILPHANGPALASELAATPIGRSIPVILYGDSTLHKPDQKFVNVERFVPSHSPVDLLRAIAGILGGIVAH